MSSEHRHAPLLVVQSYTMHLKCLLPVTLQPHGIRVQLQLLNRPTDCTLRQHTGGGLRA